MSAVLTLTQRRLAEEEKRLLEEQRIRESELQRLAQQQKEQEAALNGLQVRLSACRAEKAKVTLLIEQMHKEQLTVLTESKASIPIVELRRLICQYAETPPIGLVEGVRIVEDPKGVTRQVHFYELNLSLAELVDKTWTIKEQSEQMQTGGFWGCFTFEAAAQACDRRYLHHMSAACYQDYCYGGYCNPPCCFTGRMFLSGNLILTFIGVKGLFDSNWDESGRPSLFNYKFAIESISPRNLILILE